MIEMIPFITAVIREFRHPKVELIQCHIVRSAYMYFLQSTVVLYKVDSLVARLRYLPCR